jgi:signal transduction histidine kinase
MSGKSDSVIREAEAVIDHLYETTELEKLVWARELHDEIGGLMVSAVMDLSAACGRMTHVDPHVKAQLERVRVTLESAIDVSRRMVEELRPSILDNFGLFAALKWQLKKASRDSNATCTESYPHTEPVFEHDASTALFRIAQDALAMTFKRGAIKSAGLIVLVKDGTVSIQISDDGTPEMLQGEERGAATALASMQHRLRTLGGKVDMVRTIGGGTVLTANMPLTS